MMSKNDDALSDPRMSWPKVEVIRLLRNHEARALKAGHALDGKAHKAATQTRRDLKDLRAIINAARPLIEFVAHKSRSCTPDLCDCGARFASEKFERTAREVA